MPFDTWGSHLESEIADLEEYIQWVGNVLDNQEPEPFESEWQVWNNRIGQKLLADLRRDKESKQRQLEQHRRRDAESGVKY